jgi:hypothetical protein
MQNGESFSDFYTSSNLPASARFNWSYVLSSADSNTCDLAYSTTKAFYVETNYYSKKLSLYSTDKEEEGY